ncbi:uncharacterized protein TRAVEDRAFT_17736 [Trametes versicolor FP-101664 SS1]|uniref:uncharacterized protein n=1 Tax=Trametes versicolor (strain FP-101664) TaxID=717944 RepID=UPI0004622D1F|nr:uncharacterized protein TRAVEDRAFT_17736 [Trametes versicolor FP-101664 SS1]EIW63355.1 hypothetical protein TRAVEDRAFT_17736 [Trametes versicolor FP-101664 SS1]
MQANKSSPSAKYNFPKACGSNSVAYQLVDGKTGTITPATKTQLIIRDTHDAKALCMNVMHADTCTVGRILQREMPYLEHLQIETVLCYPNTNNRIRCPDPIPYLLFAVRFPALQSLMVRDTCITMDTPLCRNLRFLYLEHQDKVANSLHLADFLNMLHNCVALKGLWLDRYIDVSQPIGTRPPLSLEHHKQLTHVRFNDEPHVVSAILSQLVIPPHVAIATVAYTASEPPPFAFHAMLPDDTDKLQILRHATDIRVCDTERHGRGTAAHIRGPDTDIPFSREILPNHGHKVARDHDGALLQCMIAHLDVYKACPLRTLKVVGNLQYMNKTIWATALHRFPNLEVLDVEDTQPMPSSSLDVLLMALQARSPGAEQLFVICPRLQRFRFVGRIYSGRPLDAVHSCFSERGGDKSGTQPLRELVLDVDLDPDTEWRPALIAIHEQKLKSIVGSGVSLRIVAPR